MPVSYTAVGGRDGRSFPQDTRTSEFDINFVVEQRAISPDAMLDFGNVGESSCSGSTSSGAAKRDQAPRAATQINVLLTVLCHNHSHGTKHAE